MNNIIVHRYLYNDLGILHRDISLNNILLRRGTGADETDEAVGLLIDFDYAELLILDGSSESVDEVASSSGSSESSDSPHQSHIKPFRTVRFYLFADL